jgi:hypothetical protein
MINIFMIPNNYIYIWIAKNHDTPKNRSINDKIKFSKYYRQGSLISLSVLGATRAGIIGVLSLNAKFNSFERFYFNIKRIKGYLLE